MAFSVTNQLGTTSGSGATIVMSPNANIAAGSLIVVVVSDETGGTGVGTIADSAGNSYVPANNGAPNNNANLFGQTSVWYVLSCLALTTSGTITYTKSISGNHATISAISATYAGAIQLDDNLTPTTGNNAAPASGTSASRPTGQLFVAGLGGFTRSTATFTQATGWSNGPNYGTTGNAGSSNVANAGGNLIASGAGTQTWTPAAWTSNPWVCFLLSFSEVTPPADGWACLTDLFIRPPRRSGTIASSSDGIARPFSPWQNAGWEVGPPHPRRMRPERVGATMIGDAGISPLVGWVNGGWEVHAAQPGHPRPERFAAVARGDDGTQAPFTPPIIVRWGWEQTPPLLKWNGLRYHAIEGKSDFVSFDSLPFGWETQSHQPRHPRPERAGAVAGWSNGNDARLLNWQNAGWEVQAFQPPHLAPERRMPAIRSEDGIEAQFSYWIADGWEVQPFQPSHPRPERIAALLRGDDGAAAAFINWRNSGWEVAAPPPPHPRRERSGALLRGDDGAQGTFVSWLNAGWGVQDFQPGHPRPERAGAVMRGDDGNEAIFSFVVVPIIDGWEVAPAISYLRSWRRAASGLRGDDGTAFPLINWRNAGWEIQPPPPPHPRPERAGAWVRGDDGVEGTFSRWLNAGWEVMPFQPNHPRPERAAATMRGDDGSEAVFAFAPATFASMGWGTLLDPQYRVRRLPALLRGDDGTQASFVNWRNGGWEIQAAQPGHPRPEQRFGAVARGDDGAVAPFVLWLNGGWESQPWQVRRRQPNPWTISPPGIDAPFTPPSILTWGWGVPDIVRRARPGSPIVGADAPLAAFQLWRNSGWEVMPPPPPHPGWARGGAFMRGDDGAQQILILPPIAGWEPTLIQPRGRPRVGLGAFLNLELLLPSSRPLPPLPAQKCIVFGRGYLPIVFGRAICGSDNCGCQ